MTLSPHALTIIHTHAYPGRAPMYTVRFDAPDGAARVGAAVAVHIRGATYSGTIHDYDPATGRCEAHLFVTP